MILNIHLVFPKLSLFVSGMLASSSMEMGLAAKRSYITVSRRFTITAGTNQLKSTTEDYRSVAASVESGRSPAERAIQRTLDWLFARQHQEGYWCGELQGDTILESETILLLAWLGRRQDPIASKAAKYILQQQLPEGGWSMYPGGSIDISGSVKAYFALKLTGHDPTSDYMQRACEAIRAEGGADRVNSFTRFYLALLGQISYEHCPAVPPEAVLLPAWLPVSIYQISAWSRTILVPLSIMWAYQPTSKVPAECGIEELFLSPPDQWPELRCPGIVENKNWLSWDRFFRTADKCLKWAERNRFRPLRRWAIKSAEKWMLDRFDDSDGLGAIFPPIIWSIIALKCLGYDDQSPELLQCHQELQALMIEEEETVRLQPCKSPVWDTAITLRSLAAAGIDKTDEGARRAIDWLLSKEVRFRGDWSSKVKVEPAGWFFEHHNKYYPDVDDTIMVMMALAEQYGQVDPLPEAIAPACRRAVDWIVAMQNSDGGWGAFDKDNDHTFLCHVPFADHNAMIDPSTPDITARVLEALSRFGFSLGDRPVERALKFVRDTQETDGSWPGRWGVNYIYGTWQVLVGLCDMGVPEDDPAIVKGAEWLLDVQQASGGWGESANSYLDPTLKGIGPATASQTAWALLGLMAAGYTNHQAVEKGIGYLLDCQCDEGDWDETEFTGTGFPLVFYLRYHMYPIYFPLMALGQWTENNDEEAARRTAASSISNISGSG